MKKLIVLSAIFLMNMTLNRETGEIYFIFGSDTSLGGINVTLFDIPYRYHTHNLYDDPAGNGYRVMDPAFRNSHKDSYGNPLVMTWWMMAGNVYRYNRYNNIPLSSSMPLYLMKKYHKESIEQFGDELSLHYHTWKWFDYDGNGISMWNQVPAFGECREEFKQVLAEYLIEDDVFPVSFRSGWHFMDNEWQALIDSLYPFSMHNSLGVHDDTEEPIDNLYDWSQATRDFVPYRVSPENYQLPGNGKGWNTRSVYFNYVTDGQLTQAFSEAASGKDQVVVMWAHLTENDFMDNLENALTKIEEKAAQYPGVKYRYTTGIEGMQWWLKTEDHTAPALNVEPIEVGSQVKYRLTTDEKIFQEFPFAAAKDITGEYKILSGVRINETTWETENIDRNLAAKVSFAVIDTSGNLAKKHIDYVPDDIYIDNNEQGYTELTGTFQTVKNNDDYNAWGRDFRTVSLAPGDSAEVRYDITTGMTAEYDIFLMYPTVADSLIVEITLASYSNGIETGRDTLNDPYKGDLVYAGSAGYSADTDNYTLVKIKNRGNETFNFPVDIFKATPLRAARQAVAESDRIDLGRRIYNLPQKYEFRIENRGFEPLTIDSVSSSSGVLFSLQKNIVLAPHESKNIELVIFSPVKQSVADDLIIYSDDVRDPEKAIGFTVYFSDFFTITDNDDQENYLESGNWATSVTMAYGPSSRYAPLNQGEELYAEFYSTATDEGIHEISYIVPTTVNSSKKALYTVYSNGEEICGLYSDQNEGSGGWKLLGSFYFDKGDKITLRVANADEDHGNKVLRADAALFSYTGEKDIVLDDANDLTYKETGDWKTSASQAYGSSSRYAFADGEVSPEAEFFTIITSADNYDISFIIPPSENAVTQAMYAVYKNSRMVRLLTYDQTQSSGEWTSLGKYDYEPGDTLRVRIMEKETDPGSRVLRTDAVRVIPSSSVSVEEAGLPLSWEISQNYPNPFNPATTINFTVPEKGRVTLKVYDILGREAATLSEGVLEAGNYSETFNASALSSGVYFYRLETSSGFTAVKKMVLLK